MDNLITWYMSVHCTSTIYDATYIKLVLVGNLFYLFI